jgi:hypothetical protein
MTARVVEQVRRHQGQLSRFWLAILFVSLGLAIIWFTKRFIGVAGDGLFVAELFVAVLIFLVLTGQISELTAGGVSAKFRSVAGDEIDPEAGAKIDVEEAVLIEKSRTDQLHRIRERLQDQDPAGPLFLVLKLGAPNRPSNYDPGALKVYAHTLASDGRFRYVVLIDRNEKLVGYMPHSLFERVFEAGDTALPFVEATNTGDEAAIRSFPGVATGTLAIGTTNADALDRMVQLNMEAMVVVDAGSRPVGMVEREKIASQMLVALTRA